MKDGNKKVRWILIQAANTGARNVHYYAAAQGNSVAVSGAQGNSAASSVAQDHSVAVSGAQDSSIEHLPIAVVVDSVKVTKTRFSKFLNKIWKMSLI